MRDEGRFLQIESCQKELLILFEESALDDWKSDYCSHPTSRVPVRY